MANFPFLNQRRTQPWTASGTGLKYRNTAFTSCQSTQIRSICIGMKMCLYSALGFCSIKVKFSPWAWYKSWWSHWQWVCWPAWTLDELVSNDNDDNEDDDDDIITGLMTVTPLTWLDLGNFYQQLQQLFPWQTTPPVFLPFSKAPILFGSLNPRIKHPWAAATPKCKAIPTWNCWAWTLLVAFQ